MRKLIKLFYVAAAVLLTAFLCSVFTRSGLNNWYDATPKPMMTPPNVVFPIVWSIIYILLVAASYLALRDANHAKTRNQANNLFLAQLLLQIGWCFLFFAHGYLGLGLAVIILLDIVVFKMIVVYSRINRYAGILLYPYYWWLIFATFLNMVFVAANGLIIVF